MTIQKFFILGAGLVVVLLIGQPSAWAEDFPLSIKGWQATLIKLEGVNTSKALAVGHFFSG